MTTKHAPLAHANDLRRWHLGDFAPGIHAARGYSIFLTGTWNGREQEILIDPDQVDGFIAALQEARDYASQSPVPGSTR